jgi:hypothetical protein
MSVQTDIVAFIDKYTYEHGRGCPKGVLLHVGGFKAKDIAAMLTNGTLESGRGSEGGIFVAGTKPSPKTIQNTSLKSRMAVALRECLNGSVDKDSIRHLLAEYEAELQKRSDAQN